MGIYGKEGIGRDALRLIEKAGRVCYKSEDKATSNSMLKFTERILERGHESVIEHSAMTVRFIIDRGVSHELVRHRLISPSQESTRYCNYVNNDEISVIEPFFFDPYEEGKLVNVPSMHNYDMRASDISPSLFQDGVKSLEILPFSVSIMMNSFDVWFLTCLWTQWGYLTLINEFNKSPQQARSVLPNSLKTEIVVTANFREWRHILKLRCAKAAHPQMREIMIPLHEECRRLIPVIFDDL